MEFKTVHQMYRHFAETRDDLPAYYVKRGQGWERVTWQAFGAKIKDFAIGLMALGLGFRDAVSILGLTRQEWDIADKATMSAGGVSVGVYHSNTPAQVQHVVDHSDSRILIVENKEQWDKVCQVRDQLPKVRRYIIMDPTGVNDPDLLTFSDVLDLGRAEVSRYEDEYNRRFDAVSGEDTAIIFYTSGTTGPPKGAMLTHRNILAACACMDQLGIFSPQDTSVIWLPMPHIYGRIAMIAGAYTGTLGYYAESLEKIVDNLKEIRPTVFYSVPRIFEKAYTRILGQAEQAGGIKKKLFHWALRVGVDRSKCLQAKQPIPVATSLKYEIADALVFKKIREVFGGRIRIILSGGAPISKEILEFFHAAGILPLELYGITEVLLCSINLVHKYKFGSVGPPGPGVQIRIADDGEIMVKSPMVFKGYLKDEEKTKEVLSEDGWYATGDIGRIDEEGFLMITDRKKDLLITAGGKNVAPQNIENLMKTSPYISQFMAYGDGKPYLTGLVTLDQEEILKWAKSHGIEETDFRTLCAHPKVRELIAAVIEEKNRELARYEQIKDFRIVPEEFSQADGTLTATLKVRRRDVVKRYQDLLEEMYKKEA